MRRHFLLLIGLVCVVSGCFAENLKRSLDRELRDKIFLLRNFYGGDVLHYNALGEPIGSTPLAGSWTVDGAVSITKVSTHNNHVELQARRYFLLGGQDGYDLAPTNRSLNIDGDFGTTPLTRDIVDRFISHVFLNQADNAAEMVPPFWKPCFGQPDRLKPCGLSPRLQSLFRFGSVFAQAIQNTSANTAADLQAPDVQRLGPGISPPHATHAPDPEYSDEARRSRIQAIVILELVVDALGRPDNVKVVSPAGYGLDEKALDIVKTWKFEPARRGTEPVAVQIDVEVTFRLYN